MATYPIKMLKDENGTPFVPLISLDSVQDMTGQSINEILDKKLEVTNLVAGTQIELEVDGNNITISNSAEGTKLIDNLESEQAGVGALDAHQGKVLLEKIPTIANNLNTPESGQALSAYQGYVLAGRVAPTGGAEGQVLKKASTDDYDFEWGDAADPNAIVGDGSIMKIIELTYEEYLELESNGQLQDDTEYHISDWNENERTYITEEQIQELILNQTDTKISKSYSYNNKDLNDLIDTAFYYCNGAINRPTNRNGYIFVQNTGTDYAYQKYITYNAASTYERVRTGGEWQPWTEVIYDSGWRDLELLNGWSVYSGQVIPQIRRIGKHVYLRGLLLATADTTSRYAVVIPEDCRPNITNNLYFSMIVANNNDSTKRCEMVQITPPDDGRILVFGSYKEADWFGLENLHWSID